MKQYAIRGPGGVLTMVEGSPVGEFLAVRMDSGLNGADPHVVDHIPTGYEIQILDSSSAARDMAVSLSERFDWDCTDPDEMFARLPGEWVTWIKENRRSKMHDPPPELDRIKPLKRKAQ